MSAFKKIFLLLSLAVMISAKAQTITDYVRMIDTRFEPYQEGEIIANDSLTDLQNGYYQRGKYEESEGNKANQILLRQVIVLNNEDNSKTLVESSSYYNGACMTNAIRFFSFTAQILRYIPDNEYYTPLVNKEDLLTEEALRLFRKKFVQADKAHYPTLRAFISGAYDNIRYELPRYGTDIILHLDFCDQFGEGIDLTEEELNTLKKGTVPLKLAYDRKQKQFVK